MLLWGVGRDPKMLPFDLLLSDSLIYFSFSFISQQAFVEHLLSARHYADALKTENILMVPVHEALSV